MRAPDKARCTDLLVGDVQKETRLGRWVALPRVRSWETPGDVSVKVETDRMGTAAQRQLKQAKASHLERELLFALRVAGLKVPQPELEFRFHASRKWRFDLAWPDRRLAVEVEGGIWASGRHNRAPGFIADCDKYNEAALLGWRVLRVTQAHIESGAAVAWIRRALLLEDLGAAL